MAGRSRRLRTGLRLLAQAGIAAAVIAGVVTGMDVVRDRPVAAVESVGAPASVAGSFAVAQSGEVAKPTRAEARRIVAATTPAIPTGRTDLGGGIIAQRFGDTVLVTFDTPEARTRRSDKFERVVRETLPVVLGETGRSALAAVEPGTLVPVGQLLAIADSGTLQIAVGDGRMIRLVPGARAGRDGPLVVTYQAVIEPAVPPSAS